VILTVATWNIHAGIGRDRRLDLARIWRVIELIDADLIGLQEVVLTDLHDDLLIRWAQAAGYATHFVTTRAGPLPGSYFGNMLLSRLPLAEQPALDLSVPGRERRQLLCAEVTHQSQRLAIWVAHLGLKRWERRYQVERIHAYAHRAGDHPTHRLLIGDFNEWWPGPGTLRSLHQSFRRLNTPASFPAHRPFMALDAIWLAGAIEFIRQDAIDHPLVRIASDHRPIRAQIVLFDTSKLGSHA
jgi:endonuclease/exonuclease/phosphatase family metal-dependent hydrolase